MVLISQFRQQNQIKRLHVRSAVCVELSYPATDGIGTGYCFWSISFFLSFFLYFFVFFCQQDYEKTARPICMKFSGKVWSDHGTTWFNFGSIRRNRAMPRCVTRGRGLLCFSTTACFELFPHVNAAKFYDPRCLNALQIPIDCSNHDRRSFWASPQ